MTKNIVFVKMTAAGNDFVMIDNRSGIIPRRDSDVSALARRLCDRKFGVGADGMILIELSRRADFKMRYLNSDGSEVSMCGNGARSVARFARYTGVIKKSKGTFETPAGIIRFELKKSSVKIELPSPRGIKLDFPITIGNKKGAAAGSRLRAHFADTGVPHAVIFVGNIGKTPVVRLGRAIRNHIAFALAGTNADFVKVTGPSSISVRTYERGVENETLACGTGVAASAIISGVLGKVRPPVKCLTRGGKILTVDYKISRVGSGASIRASSEFAVTNVSLEGPAEVVFIGKLRL
ncbi:MAG: diaminopimelate epimerase [Endomicrobiia bacterium]|nr:diaminopimelate epimerase [Endomicrobiia bacterium]